MKALPCSTISQQIQVRYSLFLILTSISPFNTSTKSVIELINRAHQQISNFFHNLLRKRLGILILLVKNYFFNFLMSGIFLTNGLILESQLTFFSPLFLILYSIVKHLQNKFRWCFF